MVFSTRRVSRWLTCTLLTLFMSAPLHAMNQLHPYDNLIRPLYETGHCWYVLGFVEKGFTDKAFDDEGGSTNPLRLWSCKQFAIEMLKGEPSTLTDPGFAPPVGTTLSKIQKLANDVGNAINTFGLFDAQAGHFLVTSKLRMDVAGALELRYRFYKEWHIQCFLPFYKMRLDDVCWQDCTTDTNIKELLTDDIFKNVCELGGLNLRGWDRTGPGDLTVSVGWLRDFPQYKEYLRNVRINWRLGLSVPTGKPVDEDQLLALPFGNDGSWALPFGAGIDLMVAPVFVFGADVQLVHTFGNIRCRRIKTHVDQTEHLLLHKRQAHKDFGLTQRFNLHLTLFDLCRGASLRVGYQYLKHGEDTLCLLGNDFSQQVANTAQNLQEWILHQMIVYAEIDLHKLIKRDMCAHPYLSFFARVPFNGRRSVATTNIGITFGVSF